jgi:hypothetical protein
MLGITRRAGYTLMESGLTPQVRYTPNVVTKNRLPADTKIIGRQTLTQARHVLDLIQK